MVTKAMPKVVLNFFEGETEIHRSRGQPLVPLPAPIPHRFNVCVNKQGGFQPLLFFLRGLDETLVYMSLQVVGSSSSKVSKICSFMLL